MGEAKIISLRFNPEMPDVFCSYFALHWGKTDVCCSCMQHALKTALPLPQFELKEVGCGK